jgi:hypothetical protein
MFKLPSAILCPMCKKEINLEGDEKGLLKAHDLITMRVKTPIFVHSAKTGEVSLDMSVCSHCKTIIGITRKAM